MTRTTMVLAMGLVAAVPALSTATAEVSVEAAASLTAEAKIEISDEEALQDDILLVLDLPIIVADAREAGVEEAELQAVLTTTAEAGVSAGVTAELVLAETETTKAKGKRKGLGVYVRRQLAQGVAPKDIAVKVRDREEVLEDMTPEERAELDKKINELRDFNRRYREARKEKRKELVNHGQQVKLIAHAAHDARKAELMARKAELEAARDANKDARKEHKEAKEELEEAREEHKEAREDLKGAQTPEERKEAKEELKEAKKEHKEAKKELKEAKEEHKEAKKDVEDAHKGHHEGHKKGGPPPGAGAKGNPGAPGGKKKGG